MNESEETIAWQGFAQKRVAVLVRAGGRLTIAQRFIAGTRGFRGEVRGTDD